MPTPTAPIFLAGQTLAASKLQQLWSGWTTYTPVLTATTTNPTLGTGSVVSGEYLLKGDEVSFRAKIAFGTSGVNAGSGTYLVSLPWPAPSADRTLVFLHGLAELNFSGTGFRRLLRLGNSASTAQMEDLSAVAVAHNVPLTWAASSFMVLSGTYRAAVP